MAGRRAGFYALISVIIFGCSRSESESNQQEAASFDEGDRSSAQRGGVGAIPSVPLTSDASIHDVGVTPVNTMDSAVAFPIDARTTVSDATVGKPESIFDMTALNDAGASSDAMTDRPEDSQRPDVSVSPSPSDGSLPVPLCPPRSSVTACLFTETTRTLLASVFLRSVRGQRHNSAESMTPLEAQQLLRGFECGGLFMPATIQAAFNMIDDDGVVILTIEPLRSEARFTWFRFYMGDTEVGYIFHHGSLRLAALVSDQEVNRCTISSPEPFELTCAELDECLLSRCTVDDINCRQTCIRATGQAALEAYISYDECRSDCDDRDQACIARVCADDQRACFQPE